MANIEITNRTRARISLAKTKSFASSVLEASGKFSGASISITFVGDRRMQALNTKWRGIDRTTDVLSFNLEDEPSTPGAEYLLGDIVISSRQAALDAEEEGVSFDAKLQELILHGILHLMGYDHENSRDARAMDRRKTAILKKTGRS